MRLHCPQAACSHPTARAPAAGAQLAGLCGIVLWAKPHFMFVVVGHNLDDFVPGQMRPVQAAVLTDLPSEHCGAITFRKIFQWKDEASVKKQLKQLPLFLQCFSNHVCKQV